MKYKLIKTATLEQLEKDLQNQTRWAGQYRELAGERLDLLNDLTRKCDALEYQLNPPPKPKMYRYRFTFTNPNDPVEAIGDDLSYPYNHHESDIVILKLDHREVCRFKDEIVAGIETLGEVERWQ